MKVIGIDKESLSNHNRVEIYCDISGTEEYTPFVAIWPCSQSASPWFGPEAPGPGVWDLIWEVRCLNHFGDSSHYPDLDVVEVGE